MVSYKDAGVDIEQGNELVKRLKEKFPHIGGFGGMYPLGDNYLIAGADGVGTKLKIAISMQSHHTVGIDLVAMSVNDIITCGAKPLFFLDYLATSKLDVSQAEEVISGIAEGCLLAECVLLGGETAEMPGFYLDGEYDLSGFAVGIVSKDNVIDGSHIKCGDVAIGVKSSGVHSNGFSLIRKILDDNNISLLSSFAGLPKSVGEMLLTPTRIYVKKVLPMLRRYLVKGIAHITGGGLIDNIPRILPKGLGCHIKRSWEIPKVFQWIMEKGCIEEKEMYKTFNMGVGMVLVMDKEQAFEALKSDDELIELGSIVEGSGIVWS